MYRRVCTDGCVQTDVYRLVCTDVCVQMCVTVSGCVCALTSTVCSGGDDGSTDGDWMCADRRRLCEGNEGSK